MNTKNLIPKIRSFFSAPSRQEEPTKAELAQSLKDTSELLNLRIEEVKRLKSEREYLYNIYLHRNNCRFQLEFDNQPRARLLLITTSFDANKLETIIYIPREQLQIATIYAHPSDDTLAIDTLSVDYVQCDACVGKYLLRELIAQANALGLSIIIGQLDKLPGTDFSIMAEFYKQAGFEVRANKREETGVLLHRLGSSTFLA